MNANNEQFEVFPYFIKCRIFHEEMELEHTEKVKPMRAIFALSRAQFLLLVVTRSRDRSRECHVTKHKMPARLIHVVYQYSRAKRASVYQRQGVTSHCPISKIPGPFHSAHRALHVEGYAPKSLKKRAHPNHPTLKL